jgi:glucose/mannose-6-phosphate isomerase
MIKEVDNFVDGLFKAARTKLRMPIDFNSMCICGMGGSGFSGDIIADILPGLWKIPVKVIKSTSIPNWVNDKTLVVVSSYSGNTKETLMMYDQAAKRGCKIVAITSGGELRDKCMRDSNKLIEVPTEIQPRSSIGYTIGYLANIVETAGGPKIKSDLLKSISALRKYRGKIWMRNLETPAKGIAERLHGKVPAIYAPVSLSTAALRWKNQMNENSKIIAFSGTIPELNHNEIVGWSNTNAGSSCTPVIIYEDGLPHADALMMNESIETIRSSGIDPEIIKIDGRTQLERSLKAIMLGDYVSLFLASINGVNPMEVEVLLNFKQRVAILLGRSGGKPKKKKT